MRQQFSDTRLFLREFRNTFTSTGAILPSGKPLARALAKHVSGPTARCRATCCDTSADEPQQGKARRILEVGPGTGPVTSQIVQQMGPDDTLDLVELNRQFFGVLKRRLQEDRQWLPVAGRVRLFHLPIEELSVDKLYDVIISGLPLNNFPSEQVKKILSHFHQLAATGAMLSFFEYVALRTAKSLVCKKTERLRLSRIEQLLTRELSAWQVDRQCILANMPPAWVHYLRLPGKSKSRESRGQSPRFRDESPEPKTQKDY